MGDKVKFASYVNLTLLSRSTGVLSSVRATALSVDKLIFSK